MQKILIQKPECVTSFVKSVVCVSLFFLSFIPVMTAYAAPPVITSEADTTVDMGQPYHYQVIAHDPEGSALSYSFIEYPAGMAVNSTGLITWTPNASQVGSHVFNIEVQDQQEDFAAYQYVEVSVIDPNNQPPIIGAEPGTQTQIGTQYSYALEASDADNDTLSYSFESWPEISNAQISETGVFTWNPATDRELVGEYWISIEVSDGRFGKAERQYWLRLEDPANQLPVVGQLPELTTNVGETFIYDPMISDPDGDALTFELMTWPLNLGIQISSSGVLTWTPTREHAGHNGILLRISDGHLGVVDQEFELWVEDTTNRAPVFTSQPPLHAFLGLEYRYEVQVSDPDGDSLSVSYLDGQEGMTFDSVTRTLLWTPEDSALVGGVHGVMLDARDGIGGRTTHQYDLTVSDPSTSGGDTDGDGVPDNHDAFPNDASETVDTDGDGIGNNADTDDDGDSVNDDSDAFPLNPTESLDTDGDGIGNNNDDDDDNDGVLDVADVFPLDASEWLDLDGDGIGDNSDSDRDGDGVSNNVDAFPNDPTETVDTDGDGVGNNTDSDDDEDGVLDENDAFPLNENESVDTDGDGIGNNEDEDDDGDQVPDTSDLFPLDPTESADLDNDGVGDNSDSDRDGDGVDNAADAFPSDPMETVDTDGDGVGNNTDTDDDADGVADTSDAFPLDATESLDSDGDGVGDNSDSDRDGDGIPNDEDAFPDDPSASSDLDGDGVPDATDPDRDGDGVDNDDDAFPGDPTETIDTDADGLGNNADTDDDNDGVLDINDAFPLNASETLDTDADGIGNNADNDDDNDGMLDSMDAFPLNPAETVDTDGDGIGNNADTDDDNDSVPDTEDAFPLDPSETRDTDGDGIGNNTDSDDDNDGVADINDDFPLNPAETLDTDSDGLGNNVDTDDDNDGVVDGEDAFPLNPLETLDSDADGTGNNTDQDDDNDGVVDTNDAFPLDATESADTDGDGIGNNADTDDDNDGVTDLEDAFPNDSTESADLDGDGIGDNSDLDRDGDGVPNDEDAFPNDPNGNADQDGDGIPDASDTDRDGDGVNNDVDAFPGDANESVDTDNDGTGNNSDTDDDNDGVIDTNDAFPLDATETLDTDGDGTGNNADTDDDNDSVLDGDDAFPLDSTEQTDTDGDGIGNNTDTDDDGDGTDDSVDAFPLDSTENSDLDSDGVGDNADTDRDGDGVLNTQDRFPDDATESRDLDNDNIGDNADTDRDGDGVDNNNDPLPNDPSVSQLSPAQNFVAAVNAQQVNLSWTPLASHQALVDEFRVYRGGVDESSSTLLATVPASATSYVDTTVINGQAYGYRVVAATSSNVVGQSTVYAPIFVAYNNQAISGFSLDSSSGDVVLNWDSAPSVTAYRIYRSEQGASQSALSDVTQPGYTDSTVTDGIVYRYQLATLMAFVNPINGANVSLLGPQSNALVAGTALPIEAQLNAQVVSAGQYQRVVSSAQVAMSGHYSNAAGVVEISATRAGQTQSATSSNGDFQLLLPFSQSGEQWTITLFAQANPTDSVVLTLTLLSDTSEPVVTLTESSVSTNASSYNLRGSMSDALGNLQSVVARSSRFGSTEFQVNQDASGNISASIPLLAGENLITVVAVDDANNRGSADVAVTRTISETPVIHISSPTAASRTTAESATVSGVVYTSLPASDIRISLGSELYFPDATAASGAYAYSFPNQALAQGLNTFTVRAETTAGTQTASVSITRYIEQDVPPVLILSRPVALSYTRNDTVMVSGTVSGGTPPRTLTINGAIHSIGATDTFQTPVDIASLEGEHAILISVVDAVNRQDQRTVRVIRDITPPSIALSTPGLEFAPAVNAVTEMPFPISGTLQDANIAALTVNGRSVSLIPGSLEGQFEFTSNLSLPIGVDQAVSIVARDLAGNQSLPLDYVLNASPETSIELVAPAQGSTLALSVSNANVDVLARLSQAQPAYTASVSIDNGAPVPVVIESSVINAQIPVDIATHTHELVLDVRDAQGVRVAVTRRQFTTESLDNVPLHVNIEPQNGAVGINPNDSLTLVFNRPIDPSLLVLDIRESVNGLTILVERNDNPSDFPSVENAEPVQVNRVQEVVAGEFGMLPGNTVGIFHPSRIYAYGAEVYIGVRYDGEELARASFEVRAIPTFLQATVVDQQGQPLNGVQISIPEKGLTTTSNANGSFSFGFGLPPEKQLTGGQVKLVFNPGNALMSFGEVSQYVYLQAGHLNRAGTTKVPLLSPDIAYRPIASGQSTAVLAKEELTLDLSDADLLFPDGRRQGSVHVQFTPANSLSHGSLRSAMPQWLFAIQPAGIEVTGRLGVTIQVPALQGTYDYLPAERFYVLMVGLDPDTLTIVPIGVGLLENNTVNATLTEQRVLDYIGYVMVAIDQHHLKDAMEGRKALAELISELENSL